MTAAPQITELYWHRKYRPTAQVGTLANGHGVYFVQTNDGSTTYLVRQGAINPGASAFDQAKGLTDAQVCGATFTDERAAEMAAAQLRNTVRDLLNKITWQTEREQRTQAKLAELAQAGPDGLDVSELSDLPAGSMITTLLCGPPQLSYGDELQYPVKTIRHDLGGKRVGCSTYNVTRAGCYSKKHPAMQRRVDKGLAAIERITGRQVRVVRTEASKGRNTFHQVEMV